MLFKKTNIAIVTRIITDLQGRNDTVSMLDTFNVEH